MDKNLVNFLHTKLPKIKLSSAEAVLSLTEKGATIPFIARYRKEKTEGLDEVEIRAVVDCEAEFKEILARKEFVLKEIAEQGNLSDILKDRIVKCWDLEEIEELYRPYKKKKKTKATIAREAGLEPLANWIWDLGHGADNAGVTLEMKAKEFINMEAKFGTYEEVLRGATNIIIERIYNDPDLREKVKVEFNENGKIVSKPGKDVKTKSKYEMYFDYSEPVKNLLLKKNSHRYLAMRRAWKDGELTVTVNADEDKLTHDFQMFACTNPTSISKGFLDMAAKQALTVHTIPSITNEIHAKLKAEADLHAIEVFANNVKKVLLSSPFGAKCVLGVDPGIRTGCKLALVDKRGQFISHTVLQMHGDNAFENAKKLFSEVTKQIEIEAIAVGNGTGGREAEVFLRKILKEINKPIPVVMVNEAGASVYSASDVARAEFADLDLTVRGAISIARRLQDPLAELVKIDPKSIGVGQYQHDVAQNTLKKKLGDVVESCVNSVGVDVNTASPMLLQYVSGIGEALAQNIIKYRSEKGLFKRREQLNEVEKISSKVFEQAAGFLRINGGDVVLDATGIHPERYAAVKDMAHELNVNVSDLIGSGADKILALRTKWVKLVGEYTFNDIHEELKKPGRDPRDPFKVFQYRDDIAQIEDVKPDMICNGIVTNVTNFGAFVDIGVHQDGLVHISELGNQFVDDPQKVVSPGDHVQVKVKAVDVEKRQISLTMKMQEDAPRQRAPRARMEQDADGGKRRVDFKDNRPRQNKEGGEKRFDSGPRDNSDRGSRSDHRGPRPDHRRDGGAPNHRNNPRQNDQKGGPPRGGPAFNNPFAAAFANANKK